MTPRSKRPYLDYQKYRYDDEKRPFFSFVKKPFSRKIKSLEAASAPSPANLTIGANPFRKQQKKKINFKKFFYTGIVLLLPILWFWLMFYLPYFDIDNVNYSGIKTLDEQSVRDYVFNTFLKSDKYWHKNNYFFVSKKKITKGMMENFDISSITVTKIFPDKLQIDITEKKHSIVLCTTRGYYLLDNDAGVIKTFWENEPISSEVAITPATPTTTEIDSDTTTIKQTPIFRPDRTKIEPGYRDLPLFCIEENKKFSTVNKKIISTDFLNNIVFWHESLEKEGIGTPEYFLGQFNQWAGFEAYFKDKKWYLKLTTEDTDKQILKIKSLINSKDSMAQVKEYIDVRFGDRVIWK